VHGDIWDGQCLVREGSLEVSGILDWTGAHSATPLKDFNFGEWGMDLSAWEPQFALLREALWGPYREARTADLPDFRCLHLLFTIDEALYFQEMKASGTAMTEWQQRRVGSSAANIRGAIDLALS